MRRLTQNPVVAIGLAVSLAVIAIALLAPVLPLADPNVTDVAVRLKPPFSPGTLSAPTSSAATCFRASSGGPGQPRRRFAAAIAAAVIGSTIGIVAGFYGRVADMVLMRGIDMLMAFPYLLLALAIVAALGPGLLNAMLAIIVVNIPFFARTVRGATLSLVNADFMAAARLSGRSRRSASSPASSSRTCCRPSSSPSRPPSAG